MCSSYIDKLHEQKNQVTILKLTELETDVMNPLERIIAHCTTVKSKLKDLQALKKDYMLFLQEKKQMCEISNVTCWECISKTCKTR